MTTKSSAYPLRLPVSITAEFERRAAAYIAARHGRADWAAFDRLMAPSGGEPPRRDDKVPQEDHDGRAA